MKNDYQKPTAEAVRLQNRLFQGTGSHNDPMDPVPSESRKFSGGLDDLDDEEEEN